MTNSSFSRGPFIASFGEANPGVSAGLGEAWVKPRGYSSQRGGGVQELATVHGYSPGGADEVRLPNETSVGHATAAKFHLAGLA